MNFVYFFRKNSDKCHSKHECRDQHIVIPFKGFHKCLSSSRAEYETAKLIALMDNQRLQI